VHWRVFRGFHRQKAQGAFGAQCFREYYFVLIVRWMMFAQVSNSELQTFYCVSEQHDILPRKSPNSQNSILETLVLSLTISVFAAYIRRVHTRHPQLSSPTPSSPTLSSSSSRNPQLSCPCSFRARQVLMPTRAYALSLTHLSPTHHSPTHHSPTHLLPMYRSPTRLSPTPPRIRVLHACTSKHRGSYCIHPLAYPLFAPIRIYTL